ncbi:MAG TPA: hypothetical protein VGH51_18405 [Candidatus Angelobacter sp.]|jgi:hypothetical protein
MDQIDKERIEVNESRAALIAAIRIHEDKGPFEITAAQLSTEVDVVRSNAENVLEELAEQGELKKSVQFLCPCDRRERLTTLDALCSVCDRAFGIDVEGQPKALAFYCYDAPQSRDVRWMVALHGMNSLGPWQEEFMWRVSRTYGYSVPVAIYKYGVVRSGAVLKFRQRALMNGLIAKMHVLAGDAGNSGFPGPPDVIAHSFGTWLLGHALASDESLRVGRVILLGCILRPDFSWEALVARGQVQAVLCHYSAKDFWAKIAHYIIPDSGPSGRIGFNDRQMILHYGESELAHSDYFLPSHMPRLFQSLWAPFLTRALQRTRELSNGPQRSPKTGQ